MALHSMVVFLLLAGHLCCTSQADASTPRGVRFGQQGGLSRVVFELPEDVPYRLEAGPDPTLIRIIFPTLRFAPKLQVARARTGLIQEVRWSTNGSQVMADIVLKQPGTVQQAARLHAPPRVVVDLVRRHDGEVQQESEGAKGQGKVAAAPRVTDAHPQGSTATSPPQAASPIAQTPPLPPASSLTPTQLLERAEKQWAARQLDAAQRSYTAFLQRYPEHPSNHLMAARVADILRAQAHYRAALEAYVVVVQGYPGSEGAIISQIRMAELGTTFPDLLPAGDEPRYTAYRHPLETLQRLTSDYPFSPLADVARFKLAEILLQQQDSAMPLFAATLMPCYQRLLASGMDETLARHLVEKAQNSLEPDKLSEVASVQEHIARLVMKSTPASGPLQAPAGEPIVAAFVGPTGVGKTTTIAKLAAHYALGDKRRAALVTLDTYRIAAVEQLRLFAKIIGLPVDIVLTADELAHALARHRDKEIVLIDTAGRSQRDALQMAELTTFFTENQHIGVHLVLSSTASRPNLNDTVARFEPLGLTSLVFTKLDESTVFGPLLSTALHAQIPMSYFTTGQRVPEDIEVATPERVVDLILNVSQWHDHARVTERG